MLMLIEMEVLDGTHRRGAFGWFPWFTYYRHLLMAFDALGKCDMNIVYI